MKGLRSTRVQTMPDTTDCSAARDGGTAQTSAFASTAPQPDPKVETASSVTALAAIARLLARHAAAEALMSQTTTVDESTSHG
jgi:hypothetical protein